MTSAIVTQLFAAQDASGRSARSVALKLGIDPSIMSHYRSGAKSPSLDVLMRWADELGLSLKLVEPVAAATIDLMAAAQDLTLSELQDLILCARAFQHLRGNPAQRPLIEAVLGVIHDQLQPASGRRRTS